MRSVSIFSIIMFFWFPLHSEIMKVNMQNGTVNEFEINSALHILFEDAGENEIIKILKMDQTTDILNLTDIIRITFNPGNESKDNPAEIQEIAKVSVKDLRNYPNPFNPSTNICFNLEKGGYVTVEIYNSGGQLVRSLVRKQLDAGSYEFFWDGRSEYNSSVSTGYYFTKVAVSGEAKTKRMLLVK